MKKLYTLLALALMLSVWITNTNAAEEDDFLLDIFGGLWVDDNTQPAEPANPEADPYDPWAEYNVEEDLNEVELNAAQEQYTPWGQLVVDEKLESDIVIPEQETLTTQTAAQTQALPTTWPTEAILFLISLMVAWAVFYKKRKTI